MSKSGFGGGTRCGSRHRPAGEMQSERCLFATIESSPAHFADQSDLRSLQISREETWKKLPIRSMVYQMLKLMAT